MPSPQGIPSRCRPESISEDRTLSQASNLSRRRTQAATGDDCSRSMVRPGPSAAPRLCASHRTTVRFKEAPAQLHAKTLRGIAAPIPLAATTRPMVLNQLLILMGNPEYTRTETFRLDVGSGSAIRHARAAERMTVRRCWGVTVAWPRLARFRSFASTRSRGRPQPPCPNVLTHLIRCFVHAISKHLKGAVDIPDGGEAHAGSIVFIQKFTKTVTLFPHLHVLFLDGVYVQSPQQDLMFVPAPPPSTAALFKVGEAVFRSMERFLKRKGFLNDQDQQTLTPLEKWWLKAISEPSNLKKGPIATNRTFGANFGGFNIHGGVRIKQGDAAQREKLIRYMCRPPFSEEQLERLDDGRVRFELRSPTHAGQTSITFEPLQFLRRVAWQIHPPQDQVRFYGVLGATHKLRNVIVPCPRIQGANEEENKERYRVPWQKLLAKVYHLDNQVCVACGESLKPIGAVTDWSEATKVMDAGILVLGEAPRGLATRPKRRRLPTQSCRCSAAGLTPDSSVSNRHSPRIDTGYSA